MFVNFFVLNYVCQLCQRIPVTPKKVKQLNTNVCIQTQKMAKQLDVRESSKGKKGELTISPARKV